MPQISEARAQRVARIRQPISSLLDCSFTVLSNYVESFGYANGYLFDMDGTLLFEHKTGLEIGSNLLTGPLKGSELAEVFDRVRTLLQSEVSDYQIYPGRSQPAAFIAGPVFTQRGGSSGLSRLELNNEHVFRVFNDYSGLGATGEAMVAMRRRQRIYLRCAAASRAGSRLQVSRPAWRPDGSRHAEWP